jgi:MarR family transcriptional regulator, temperature-dependent positive regulator of motility
MRTQPGGRNRSESDGYEGGEASSAAGIRMAGPATAEHPEGGHDEMTAAKLWRNPCWLTYRLNYLALRYNVPLYSWVERTYGLSRPEYVVIFSLGLKDGALARDIASSSGFPQNTLSRAIHKLVVRGLIRRTADAADRRCNVLTLTPAGRTLFEDSLPRFVAFEHMMLEALTETERATLSGLMAKMVLASQSWPTTIEAPSCRTDPET